ncbi:alpha/beta hydrolase [Trebonia kvetii]|uniref:alpha/beta hydrolase n=1 Tax=Trebonia kvetii TaxID=2480626 RepID=UPI00165208FC|nr:alpha/beta hydrolase fold domain-containing protein [Trebonia kvetii]
MTEEPASGLPGSLLFAPAEARQDLVILLIHGGGFRTGDPGQLRTLAGLLASRTGARVLSPWYRLAPEHPYPAGLEDCERAYDVARELAPRVVVGGESAGANLAAALLLRRRAAGDASPLAGVLFSGVYDLRTERYRAGSWTSNAASDQVLTAGAGPIMQRDYAPGGAGDPGISPLLADLAGLPPLLVMASSAELLLDDSIEFAVKAGRAGVETVLEIWPGMPHSWSVHTGLLPEGVEAAERAAAFIVRVATGRVVDGAALA